MHRISRWIVNYCFDNNIQNIIIGKNWDWKRNCDIGQVNNQIFCQMPFDDLVDKIIYKSEEKGINVDVVCEQYTSKSSFIDNDIIPVLFDKYEFSGKRVKRGLYKSKDATLINADVNASYNILRKGNPEFKYDDRIQGISLYPIRLNV
jgi:putative transposase